MAEAVHSMEEENTHTEGLFAARSWIPCTLVGQVDLEKPVLAAFEVGRWRRGLAWLGLGLHSRGVCCEES